MSAIVIISHTHFDFARQIKDKVNEGYTVKNGTMYVTVSSVERSPMDYSEEKAVSNNPNIKYFETREFYYTEMVKSEK